MVSLCSGTALFLSAFKWFPVAEMLRSCAVDLFIPCLILLLPVQAASYAIIALFVPLLLLSLAGVLHVAIYHSGISSFSVMSTLETSANEASEFLAEYVTPFTVLAACATTLVCLFLLWRALKANREVRRGRATTIAALLVIGVCGYFTAAKGDRFLRSNTSYVVISSAITHQRDLALVNEIKSRRAEREYPGVAMLDAASDERKTYIFIVGESANRNHMSLYGYHRDTNPRLGRMARDLLIFNDVVSSSTHTIPSLRQALLFYKGGDDNILHSASVIGLLRRAGFSTWWLSNQTASSGGLTGTAVIVSDAEHQLFLNRSRSEGHSVSYDEVLLGALEKALADGAGQKAIFVHLLGSHLSYHLRYPGAFDIFSATDDIADQPHRKGRDKAYINQYDNSIRYTDHIVDSIIKMARAQNDAALVVYFSDHGQEVYDTLPIRGQDAKHPTRNMFDIPFIVWASDKYEQANPQVVERMRESVEGRFSLADFADTAAYLCRVTFDGVTAQRSWFAPEYRPEKRVILDKDDYDKLPALPKEAR